MKTAAKIVFSFIAFFRPALLIPSLPSTLIILPIVLFPFLSSPKRLIQPIWSLGVGSLAIAFILMWSFSIDILINGFSSMGLRSQFATAIRVVLYVYIAYFMVYFLTDSQSELRRMILWTVGIQCIIAALMFIDPRIKFFFFETLSGYTGSEKLFREYFFEVRIFGWSEELFYAGPVMMFSTVVLFFRSTYLRWLLAVILVGIVAVLNARISAIASLLLLSKYRGLATFFTTTVAVFFGGAALSEFLGRSEEISAIMNYLLDDVVNGGSRTVEILFTNHLYLPDRLSDWLLGSNRYFYGDASTTRSDIGFVIILMFGGVFYLFAWIAFFAKVIYGCSSSPLQQLLLATVFIGLGIKGLIFSGNAMLLLILVVYFERRRYWA